MTILDARQRFAQQRARLAPYGDALDVPCPDEDCQAAAGNLCTNRLTGKPHRAGHLARHKRAAQIRAELEASEETASERHSAARPTDPAPIRLRAL